MTLTVSLKDNAKKAEPTPFLTERGLRNWLNLHIEHTRRHSLPPPPRGARCLEHRSEQVGARTMKEKLLGWEARVFQEKMES